MGDIRDRIIENTMTEEENKGDFHLGKAVAIGAMALVALSPNTVTNPIQEVPLAVAGVMADTGSQSLDMLSKFATANPR